MSQRLPNYLKTYRKRAGLSQDEVAFLLGCQSGTKFSRYEGLARKPGLETAFAYQAFFDVLAKELFAGIYEKVEETIHQRAQILAEKFNAGRPELMIRQKLASLKAMTSTRESEPNQHGLSVA